MANLTINNQKMVGKPQKKKFQLKLTHRSIIIWLSLAAFIHNIVMNGAMNVIISSLQKEFYLSSRDTGIYISVYDIGSLMSSLIIPILGSHGSKPKWIAFGMFMLCIGCFVNVLPHFIRPKTNLNLLNDTLNGANDVELCTKNHNLTELDFNECSSNQNSDNSTNTNKYRFDNLKYVLYASNVINGLSSASMTTLAFSYIEDIAPSSLSALYESIYYATGAFGMGVGFMITSQFLNLHNDIDSKSNVPKWMKPNHPNWVGAWWLPFIIFGTVSFLLSMFLCLFPQNAIDNINEQENSSEITPNTNTTPNHTLDTISNKINEFNENDHLNQHNNNSENQIGKNYEVDASLMNTVRETGSTLTLNRSIAGSAAAAVYIQSSQLLNEHCQQTNSNNLSNKINNSINLKNKSNIHDKLLNMFKLSYNLLRNPVFLFIVIASALEGLLQNSFLAFASLFLEYQYRIASGTASFILGALSIPPLIMGSLLSGFLIKKYQWKMRQCLLFLTMVLFLNMILYSGFFLHCKEPNILLNTNDHHSKLTASTDLLTNLTTIKNYECLKSTDSECNCNENLYKPVCLKNNDNEYVFQSSCIAGCKTYNYETSIYSNCTYAECMINDYNLNTESLALNLTNGLCPSPSSCKYKLFISYATIFLVMFFTALVYVPYIKVTLGCANTPELNAIALGIKQLAMTGIGTIPGPIIFGSFIDLTCKYWYTDCLNQKVCKLYSNRNFSLTFGTLGVGFKFICWLSVFISCISLKLRKRKSDNYIGDKKPDNK